MLGEKATLKSLCFTFLLLQILARLLAVAEAETVSFADDGMEAVIFTAQGDLRQGLNNLQSTFQGFGHIDSKNVFKVCDEPHPLLIKDMLSHCVEGNLEEAYKVGVANFNVQFWSELEYVFRRGLCSLRCTLENLSKSFLSSIRLLGDEPFVAFGLCLRRYHHEYLPRL